MDPNGITARVKRRRRPVPESQRPMFQRAQLKGEDFSGRTLQQFTSVGSRFDSCSFDDVRIADASFGGGRETSEYVNCTFDRARLAYMGGGFTRFVNCSFRDVELHDWFCFCVELIDCVFTGRLRGCVFNGTVPAEDVQYAKRTTNEFRGNDFSGAQLLDVGFRTGIDLTQQQLPKGADYIYVEDAAAAVARARAQVITWTDLDLRRDALRVIEGLQRGVDGGQRQFLLRAKDYPKNIRAEIDAVFTLLAV